MVAVTVRGVHLGGEQHLQVRAAADAALGSKIPVPIASKLGPVLNAPSVVVSEFPQSDFEQPLAVPGSGSGAIHQPGVVQSWPFKAKKGQPLIVEVEAQRLGSLLDPVLEILDAQGQRWSARCCAAWPGRPVTFRDPRLPRRASAWTPGTSSP